MQFKEGEVPPSILSDYVSAVFTQRAQAEAEALRSRDLAHQAHLEQFIQRTSPLRDHLIRLAVPIEKLLASFRVRELLEEARNILNPNSEREYIVRELRPRIYEQVVLAPQPTDSYQLENGAIDLDTILDPDNFGETVSHLEGYGVALSFTRRVTVPTIDKKQVWVPDWVESGRTGPEWWSVVRSPAHWDWDYVSAFAPVGIVKALIIEIAKTERGAGVYDLTYKHILSRVDLRSGEKEYPEDKLTYLTPPTRIEYSDQAGTLQRLIGDDIVRELDGEYEDLLHQFLTMGTRKTLTGGIEFFQV